MASKPLAPTQTQSKRPVIEPEPKILTPILVEDTRDDDSNNQLTTGNSNNVSVFNIPPQLTSSNERGHDEPQLHGTQKTSSDKSAFEVDVNPLQRWLAEDAKQEPRNNLDKSYKPSSSQTCNIGHSKHVASSSGKASRGSDNSRSSHGTEGLPQQDQNDILNDPVTLLSDQEWLSTWDLPCSSSDFEDFGLDLDELEVPLSPHPSSYLSSNLPLDISSVPQGSFETVFHSVLSPVSPHPTSNPQQPQTSVPPLNQPSPVYECPCSGCCEIYPSKEQLSQHVLSKHGRYMCTFPDCGGQPFRDKKDFERHLDSVKLHISEDSRLFQCRCGKSLGRMDKIREHFQTCKSTKQGNYECRRNQTFKDRAAFEEHYNTKERRRRGRPKKKRKWKEGKDTVSPGS